MIKPTIHMNGTSPQDLLEGYSDAMEKVSDAVCALKNVAPNGRDYYPQGDAALSQAIREHNERVKAVELVLQELTDLALHCDEACQARLRR